MDLKKIITGLGIAAFVIGIITFLTGFIVDDFNLKWAAMMSWLLWVGCGGMSVEMI